MVINALNSGAKTFMADFEDSNSPTWSNMVLGQVNLRDANRREIDFAINGKEYKLVENPAVLLVRPRGWHLEETRVIIDGLPISGSLFDFGLYFFHNAAELIKRGFGPYFYLPKMEHHLEARLWNDVFHLSTSYLRLPQGKIRATVLIETLPASYQMEEILFELKEHSSGLNCGRWDYIFSFIKRQRAWKSAVFPDRTDVTMTVPFMDAYVRLLIQTCHKRKVAAMGGMSAQIPIKNDAAANEKAMAKVRADKLREVTAGHDGTWVAHPALVKIAMDIFNENMLGPNQYYVRREDVHVAPKQISDPKVPGAITEHGVRDNISAALSYCAAWISGNGCVPINHLMVSDRSCSRTMEANQLPGRRSYFGKCSRGRLVETLLTCPRRSLVCSSGSGFTTSPRRTPASSSTSPTSRASSTRRHARLPRSPACRLATSRLPRSTCSRSARPSGPPSS